MYLDYLCLIFGNCPRQLNVLRHINNSTREHPMVEATNMVSVYYM